MTKPTNLFENGPEWHNDMVADVDVAAAHYIEIGHWRMWLLVYSDQSAVVARSPLHVGDPFKTVPEALDYIRTRIIAHRDELNRITGLVPTKDHDHGTR